MLEILWNGYVVCGSYRTSFDVLLRFIRLISLFRAPCVGVRQVGVKNCGLKLVSLIITHFTTCDSWNKCFF